MANTSRKTVEVDTLIVGAGLIGSSVAMHLTQKGLTNVRVIDLDLGGNLSSSELNSGGVRATWNQPVNVLTSKISIEYYAKVASEVGYRPCGYLWLYRPDRFDSALKSKRVQESLGWEVQAWDVAELRRRVPFINKTDDLAGAVFAPNDGLINSNLLKNHFRERARAEGTIFDDRTWLRTVESSPQSKNSLKLHCIQFKSTLESEAKAHLLTHPDRVLESESSVEVTYEANRVVNCAGAWAAFVAKQLGYQCPSQPVRRQVCIFDCRDLDLNQYGMIVDPTGVYFHPEATNGLAGFANPDEPPGFNFHYDGESFFMEYIWPTLYERATAFERLRHLTGWAGLYEVSPDHTGIVGKALEGVYEAHSFSGHGAMHSYGVGLALSELILEGKYSSLDLSILSGQRFERGNLVTENQVI